MTSHQLSASPGWTDRCVVADIKGDRFIWICYPPGPIIPLSLGVVEGFGVVAAWPVVRFGIGARSFLPEPLTGAVRMRRSGTRVSLRILQCPAEQFGTSALG